MDASFFMFYPADAASSFRERRILAPGKYSTSCFSVSIVTGKLPTSSVWSGLGKSGKSKANSTVFNMGINSTFFNTDIQSGYYKHWYGQGADLSISFWRSLFINAEVVKNSLQKTSS